MFYRAFFSLLVGVNIASAASLPASSATLPLAGEWRFALDRADAGVQEQWFTRKLADRVSLPGVLQAQGYGDEISTNTPWVLSLYDRFWYLRDDYKAYTRAGHVKVPFLCQPPRHYLGAAWYQRNIEIPKEWEGRRVVLFLERPHWETQVWLDDKLVGTNNSLCVPHEYDFGIVPPGKHRVTVRVDNRMLMPYRPDAHSVSDSLGQSWNGIVGAIELRSTGKVWLEEVRVFPRADKSVRIKVRIGNISNKPGQGVLFFGGAFAATEWDTNGGTDEVDFYCGVDAKLWDEFAPELQRFTFRIEGPDVSEQRELVFGLREFKAVGQDFVINGRPAHLRGTHHGGDFPLTGYPPCDVGYWKKLFATCKEWGLSHVRFHSFCPPEAAFTAADEIGIYLQIEPGMWNTFNPDSPMEQMLYTETERILKYYGNHPSFVLFSPSNEPKGHWKDVLPKWAEHFRAEDPRRLYTTGTGFTDADAPGPLDRVDYTATQRFGQRRLRGESGWFGRDYRNALRGVNVPVVAHELGQWCAYPDFDVIRKFTGYARPGNYEIFHDSAAARGVLEKNKDFAWASGRYQLACYKEEIEANLRTPGLAGFQLLDLHDYTGQGTALVGLLDPFWEEKGYVTAAEWRRFCNTTVPLARLTKRVFMTAEKLEADVEVAHYGATPLTNAVVSWQVVEAGGRSVAQGEFPARTLAIGRNVSLGKVEMDLSKLPAPGAYNLIVSVGSARGSPAESPDLSGPDSLETGSRRDVRPTLYNEWNFWLYPTQVDNSIPSDVLVTASWDEAEAKLAAGGKVLFLPRNTDLDWFSPLLADVPIFWNRLMNPQWGRMLGLWCDTNHPALAGFPTEAQCDWQWTELVRNARAINVDRLSRQLQPVVQAIDDWNRNWKLALLFEARVGKGRLLVSSFDIASDLDDRPVARQLRRSLLDYVASDGFNPGTAVSPEQLRGLWFDTLIMRRLGAAAQADGANANAVIDGDPNTYWLVGAPARGTAPPRQPRELTISFASPVAMNGVVLMNRQNDRNHAGDIRGYSIEASDDGQSWREIASGELVSTWSPQTVKFAQTVTATHLRLTALSGFGDDPATALAELAVIYAGPKLAETGQDKIEYRRVRTTTTEIDEGAETGIQRTNVLPRRTQ